MLITILLSIVGLVLGIAALLTTLKIKDIEPAIKVAAKETGDLIRLSGEDFRASIKAIGEDFRADIKTTAEATENAIGTLIRLNGKETRIAILEAHRATPPSTKRM